MLAKYKQLQERYERVLDFLAANAPPDAPPAFARWRDELVQAVARLNALLSVQVTGRKDSRDDVKRQKAMRRVLREKHLAPISRRAKSLLAEDPMIVKALAMPHNQLPTTRLLTEAKAFRDKAAEHEQKLIDAGRPADFLAQLDGAIEALRQTLIGRARNVGKHVGAREGVKQAMQRARQILLTVDAIVLDIFSSNAEILGRWQIAKRVQGLPGSSGPRATGDTSDENVAETPEAA